MNDSKLAATADMSATPRLAASRRRRPALQALSFRNIGAVYICVGLVGIFSLWAPETFPTYTTFVQILNGSAISGLMALSVILPLAAGVFDLSIGYTLGMCNVLLAYLVAVAGFDVELAIVVTLLAALLIGVVNCIVVAVAKIDSFIGTLGTGSLLLAGIALVSQNLAIPAPTLTEGFFAQLSQASIGRITAPVFYMVIVALVLWFVLDHTVVGRWTYATGFNKEAARLSGVPTRKLCCAALIVSALVAGGVAGIALTSQIASGDPTIGPPYLLNAFAAAFVGATQFKRGRFNAWGTVVAVLVLGTGTTGLSLAYSSTWAPSVFTGVVLLLALAVTRAERQVSV